MGPLPGAPPVVSVRCRRGQHDAEGVSLRAHRNPRATELPSAGCRRWCRPGRPTATCRAVGRPPAPRGRATGHQHREEVVGPVAGRPVPMAVAVVAGHEAVQEFGEILLEAARVSMSARPAVACGTKTWHRPSPRPRQNEATIGVRSVTRRAPVSTSNSSVSSPLLSPSGSTLAGSVPSERPGVVAGSRWHTPRERAGRPGDPRDPPRHALVTTRGAPVDQHEERRPLDAVGRPGLRRP